jgi:hypothetical protein
MTVPGQFLSMLIPNRSWLCSNGHGETNQERVAGYVSTVNLTLPLGIVLVR